MFGNKLWDKAKNDTIDWDWDNKKHHDCHGGKGKHGHHGKDWDDEDDDKKGHLGFCPVLATVYIIMACHFVYFH
jgi:hypothetical protein